jgi:hypothetical protein
MPATGIAPSAGTQAKVAIEAEAPGLAGVVLALRNGSTVSLKLPFSLEPDGSKVIFNIRR